MVKVTAWGEACTRAEQLVKPILAKIMLAEANDGNEQPRELPDS